MNKFISSWKTNYSFRTFINSIGSFLITFVFALYNGFLGIWYNSVWNGSICIYYFFLVWIRGSILLTEKRNLIRKNEAYKYRIQTWKRTSVVLFITNLYVVVPILLMVHNERPVNMGLIPAIAIAAYTTYKIAVASVNIKKVRRNDNILVRELRTINFIDALVSVLTLQNTLIIVNGNGGSYDMFVLSIISSAVIFFILVIISINLIIMQKNIKIK